MNHCMIQQNAFVAREEMRREAMICPKPRRLGLVSSVMADHSMRPLRWNLSNQAELIDTKAGNDVLDIILTKGGYCGEQPYSTQIASSPPFFCGSPPSRVSNPLIKDDRFGDEKLSTFSPLSPSALSSSPSSRKAGGCVVRANFGNKPAVRVEGFDCFNRDRRSCGIPALA